MMEHDAITSGHRDRTGQSMPDRLRRKRGRDFPAVHTADTCPAGEETGTSRFRAAKRPGFPRVRNILSLGTAAIILLDVYDTHENPR